jgi:acetylglutamate kinase
MRKLGAEPRIVGGRRVTDDVALEALEMVVGGQLNIELVSALTAAGLSAVGINGVSAGLIRCEKRPPAKVGGELVDFGHVGDVTGINVGLLDLLLDAGHVPVIACVAADVDGRPYNINADTVANRIAEAMKVDRLLLVTGTPGVLRDVSDSGSRIERLTIEEGRTAIREGIVQGGMIPKLEESFESLERGVEQIHILGALGPGDLLRAVEAPGSVGTALLRA